MLEAMLTLFVLTIGVLGVAGLQMQGLRTSGVAMQRVIVTMKVYELTERMRANIAGITNYTSTGSDQGCNSGTTCTPANMAAHDVYMFQNELNNLLPGTATVNINVTPPAQTDSPATAAITVTWTDRSDTFSYSTTADI